MEFEIFFTEQLKKHPSMQPQDIVKICYQAAYGAEHLLSDSEWGKKYLEEEYNKVSPSEGDLYEQISEEISRVNLSAWKQKELPVEWLFIMFSASCKKKQAAEKKFYEYLEAAEKVLETVHNGISMSEWKEYLVRYYKEGMGPVHHSEQYRQKERPAYRIIDNQFCRILPILEKINKCRNSGSPYVIAIDGRAASGKTTLANTLQIVLDADIIHMDDFFVPPQLRLEERYHIPGENIHHERFKAEVLPYVSKPSPFSYRIFDCEKMDYHGCREISIASFRIVEGSYSCHPKFGNYADFTIFSNVTSKVQKERIRNRNGEKMLEIFLERWIPMEEEYFSHYKIRDKVNLIL